MNNDALRLARNILFRSFVVGLALTAVMMVLTISFWVPWTALATRLFHTDTATLTPMVLKFFVDIRFFLVFVLLTPALAIHWTLKKEWDGKN